MASTSLGRKIIEIQDLTKSLDGRTLIKDLTYIAVPQDRVGIVGKNGSGKSTLLNLIAGKLTPDGGEVQLGDYREAGLFHPGASGHGLSLRAIEYVKEEAEIIRTADGRSLPPGKCWSASCSRLRCSGRRSPSCPAARKDACYLLRVLMGAPNVLLLDEPTNDLDIGTLAVLEDYLDEFPGVVFTVSHDRYFLDRTVDKLIAFEDGDIRLHVGDYSEYEEWLAKNVPSGSGNSVKAEGGSGRSASGANSAAAEQGGNTQAAAAPARS